MLCTPILIKIGILGQYHEYIASVGYDHTFLLRVFLLIILFISFFFQVPAYSTKVPKTKLRRKQNPLFTYLVKCAVIY